MAKITVNQAIAKAAKLEKSGHFKRAADAYAAILKSGVYNPAARNGFLRSVERLSTPPANPAQFQRQIAEIAALIDAANWPEAEAKSGHLVKTYPNNILLLNMHGVAKLGLNQYKQAAEHFHLALALKPDFADAYQNLGLALHQLGKPEAALKAFETAVKYNPKFAKAYDNIGSLHQLFGDYEQAIAAHKKALEIEPDWLAARRNLSVAYDKLNLHSYALREVQTLIKAGQATAANYHSAAMMMRKLAKPEQALLAIDKALELEPTFIAALLERGHCEKMLGLDDKATETFREVLKLAPEKATAYFSLSRSTRLTPDDPEIATLRALLEDAKLSLEDQGLIHFTLAYAYENARDYETSFAHLKQGNACRKQDLGYDIEQDRSQFAKIKANSGHIAALDVEIDVDSDPIEPIFILGMPRSGTTLTEQIISAHPDVFAAGELNFVQLFGGKLASGDSPATAQAIQKFRSSYLDAVLSLDPQKPYFTDKMPHNFKFLGLIKKAFPKAKIIHTQRDAAAVCWSNFYTRFSSKGLGYTHDLDDVVQHYALYEDLMQHWRNLFPDGLYELDYEKLTRDQATETRKLIDAVGLPWDDACLSPEKNKRKVLTASSGQVTQKVYTGSSQKWKRYEPYLNGAFDSLNKSRP